MQSTPAKLSQCACPGAGNESRGSPSLVFPAVAVPKQAFTASRSTGPVADRSRSLLAASGLAADRPKRALPASGQPPATQWDAIRGDEIAPISNGARFRTLERSPTEIGSSRGRWTCPQLKWHAIQATGTAPNWGPAASHGRRPSFPSCRNGTEGENPGISQVIPERSQCTILLKSCQYGIFRHKSEVPEVSDVSLPCAQITIAIGMYLICA